MQEQGTHYDHDTLRDMAVDGKAVITLAKGDTAYAPGTTKYWLAGDGGTVTYYFYPEATEAFVEGKVWRTLREGRL